MVLPSLDPVPSSYTGSNEAMMLDPTHFAQSTFMQLTNAFGPIIRRVNHASFLAEEDHFGQFPVVSTEDLGVVTPPGHEVSHV